MTPNPAPAPDDRFRGVIEFDCEEFAPPELRNLPVGRFVRERDPIPVVEIDCSSPPETRPDCST